MLFFSRWLVEGKCVKIRGKSILLPEFISGAGHGQNILRLGRIFFYLTPEMLDMDVYDSAP